LALYQAIVARRLQWDNLLWQVPVLSLTAQAFLLTIALGHDNSNWARLLAGGLSFLAGLVSMVLMAGHRHAELTDAAWLARYEADHFLGSVFHGADVQDRSRCHADAAQRRAGWSTIVVPEVLCRVRSTQNLQLLNGLPHGVRPHRPWSEPVRRHLGTGAALNFGVVSPPQHSARITR
jgi:hypothetical protein